MGHCPVCNAEVSDDFGLIECPKCSAQLIVHIDGRVEHSGAKEAPEPEPEPEPDVAHAAEPEEKFDFGEASPEIEIPQETPEVSISDFGGQFPDPNTELARIGDLGAGDEAQAAAPEPAFAESPPPEADPFAPEAEAPTDVYRADTPAAGADSPDLSDIARFGNSDLSAHEGSLRYNVYISGIDTADVREAFREAITDRKLVWDIDQILRSLKNGEVQIQNVTPPKAYVLISRLRNIPVQVRWEQYALAQSQA